MPLDQHIPAPVVEKGELSDDAKIALSMADIFYDAAVTDCYVTRALVAALRVGLSQLSDADFQNMWLEIDEEEVSDWMVEARQASPSENDGLAQPPIVTELKSRQVAVAGFGGTEEDLADLRRAGLVADG